MKMILVSLFCLIILASSKDVPLVVKEKANETMSSLLLSIFDTRQLAFHLLELGLLDKVDQGDVTVFAPTNRAFDQLVLPDLRESLKGDADYWKNILLGHAVKGKVMRKQLADGKKMLTLTGKTSLSATPDGQAHIIGGNNVTVRFLMEDIVAKNGVLHVLTHLVLPDYANAADRTKSLLTNMAAIGVQEYRNYVQEGDRLVKEYLSGTKAATLTLLAPTDEAFANLDLCTTLKLRFKPWIMRQLIQCHTLQGSYDLQDVKDGSKAEVPTLANPGTLGARVSVTRVNGSLVLNDRIRVLRENVQSSNGIIHLIDDVLCAPNSSKIVTNKTSNVTADALQRIGTLYKIAGMEDEANKTKKDGGGRRKSQFKIGGGDGGGKMGKEAKTAKDSSSKDATKEKNAKDLTAMLRERTKEGFQKVSEAKEQGQDYQEHDNDDNVEAWEVRQGEEEEEDYGDGSKFGFQQVVEALEMGRDVYNNNDENNNEDGVDNEDEDIGPVESFLELGTDFRESRYDKNDEDERGGVVDVSIPFQ